jgi:uncharacterized protein with ParB-like and HNH nuclease domain
MKSEEFEIKANTYTFDENGGSNSILSNDKKYIIPVYQRKYSWTSVHINKLIQDIFVSFWGHEKNLEPEKMFIGTMQLMPNNDNCQIIDGQQRLTTFLILFKTLQLHYGIDNPFKNFNLSTQVSNGQQQQRLDEMLVLKSIPNKDEKYKNNNYISNMQLIRDAIDGEIKDKESSEKKSESVRFNVEKFNKHILENVYFVVIETKTSLSKTLKIFDAINTTGMDLNAGDIFKIRMYEYLKDIKKIDKTDEVIFNEISEIYEKIDSYNKEYEKPFTNIQNILNIYQIYLIGKYKLPKILYTFATDTFFDRLFDTVFKIHIWTNFKDKKIDLELTVIDKLIESRYYWHKKWLGDELTVETRGMVHLWGSSRYSGLKILIQLFIYKFNDEKLAEFIKEIVKIHLIYSLGYARSIYKQNAIFTSEVVEAILNKNADGCIKYLKDYNSKIDNDIKYFETVLNGDIISHRGGKVKNIICRLSALLEEKLESTDKKITDNIFVEKIDIEHIQSANDENNKERPKIKEDWGSALNSAGNLVVLERNINRKIQNDTDKKLGEKGYPSSKIQIMKDVYNLTCDGDKWVWNKNKAKLRQVKEVEKITDFLTYQN